LAVVSVFLRVVLVPERLRGDLRGPTGERRVLGRRFFLGSVFSSPPDCSELFSCTASVTAFSVSFPAASTTVSLAFAISAGESGVILLSLSDAVAVFGFSTGCDGASDLLFLTERCVFLADFSVGLA